MRFHKDPDTCGRGLTHAPFLFVLIVISRRRKTLGRLAPTKNGTYNSTNST